MGQGDKIKIKGAAGDDTLAELGLAVLDKNSDGHAKILDAKDNARVYLILNNIDYSTITDANFSQYFEVEVI